MVSNLKRSVKTGAKNLLFQVFERGQHLGIDILPRHFYSQIPDLRVLRTSDDWKTPRDMRSIRGHELSSQIQFLRDVCPRELALTALDQRVYEQACERNGEAGYGPIEAVFLYAFIRHFKPRRVLQVGCGVSTAVILSAAADAGYQIEIVCIDPYPTAFLRDAHARGEIKLVEGKAQRFAQEHAPRLEAGDLFFVDSTHTVMPGSEVNVIIIDVLPHLGAGVRVHFHDITFPYDYQRGLLKRELFTHAETPLLHAFLSCNDRYEMSLSMAMLHFQAADALIAQIPTYRPGGNDAGLETTAGHFPSAVYLVRT